MSTEILVRFIKNGWWVVLLTVAAAVGAALLATTMATPLYQATTRYVISPSLTAASPNYGDMVYGMDALSRQSTVATYVEIFRSERAADSAAEKVALQPEELAVYEISAVVLPETSVIHLAVTGPNPLMTQQLATAIGTEAVAYIRNLSAVYEIHLLDVAKMPGEPVSPNILRTTILAAILGLIVGLLLATVRTPAILGNQNPVSVSQQSIEQMEEILRPRVPATAYSVTTVLPHDEENQENEEHQEDEEDMDKQTVPYQFDLIESASTRDIFQVSRESKGKQ